ncbi:MAG: phage tail length tape measure family protein, partial [Pseudomonadota bacterium]
MAEPLADLEVRVGWNDTRFDAGMRRSQQRFDRRAKSIENRADQMNARLSRLGGFQFSRQSRANFINFGQQIQDVAVQAEQGTDRLRIFAQQGPQILSIFGPAGVTLGIFAAITGAVASSLIETTDSTADAKEQAKEFDKSASDLASSLSRLTSATRAAGQSADDLKDVYGEASDEIRAIFQQQEKLALAAAFNDLERTIQSTSTRLGEFGSFSQEEIRDLGSEIDAAQEKIDRLGEVTPRGLTGGADAAEALREANDELDRLQDLQGVIAGFAKEFAITESEAASLVAALRDLEAADGIQQQRVALNVINDVIKDITDNYQNVPPKIEEIADRTLDAQLAMMRLSEEVERTTNFTTDLAVSAGNIFFDNAIDGARTLADELSRAVDEADALRTKGLTGVDTAKIKLQFRNNPVGEARALAAAQFDRINIPNLPDAALDDVGVRIAEQRQQFIDSRGEAARLNEQRRALDAADRKARQKTSRSARSGRSQRDQFPGQIERIQERIAQLQNEQSQLGLNERAAEQLSAAFEREKLVRELIKAAQKDGTAATAEEIALAENLAAEVETLTIAIFDETEAIEAANEAAKQAKK